MATYVNLFQKNELMNELAKFLKYTQRAPEVHHEENIAVENVEDLKTSCTN